MKKAGLFLAALLLTVTSAQASEKTTDDLNKTGITNRYRPVQPIRFVERGVVFFVYPDGTFDYESSRTLYTPNRRRSVSATWNSPGVHVSYNSGSRYNRRGVRVTRDWHGNIVTVGNVSVDYTRYGKVRRIGRVYMDYHKGRLKRVGGLRLHYGKRGHMTRITGSINHYNTGCGICGVAGCSNDHFGYDRNHYDDDHYDDYDDDYDDDYWDDTYYHGKKNKKYKKYKYKGHKRDH